MRKQRRDVRKMQIVLIQPQKQWPLFLRYNPKALTDNKRHGQYHRAGKAAPAKNFSDYQGLRDFSLQKLQIIRLPTCA